MRSAGQTSKGEYIVRILGIGFFAYLFFGFMLLPCLNTLTSIFNAKNAA